MVSCLIQALTHKSTSCLHNLGSHDCHHQDGPHKMERKKLYSRAYHAAKTAAAQGGKSNKEQSEAGRLAGQAAVDAWLASME